MSASSKRRRATSPSSSVSGGGDLDDTSSTPGSGRKRRRISNVAPVDMVSALIFVILILFTVSVGFAFSTVIRLAVESYLFLCILCPRRSLFATSCSMLSGTTRMIMEGNCVTFSWGFQREGITIALKTGQDKSCTHENTLLHKYYCIAYRDLTICLVAVCCYEMHVWCLSSLVPFQESAWLLWGRVSANWYDKNSV